MWRPWFDALGARYRFYRYESRGCGQSDRGATEASLDVLVADLEAVVDAAKLERFALLGTSQGGRSLNRERRPSPRAGEAHVLLGAFARGPMRRGPTAEAKAGLEAAIKIIEVGWGQDNPAYHQLFTSLMFPGAKAPRQLLALLERRNRSRARTLVLPSQYLEIVIEKV